MKSIVLDHCWVCSCKFIDAGGPEVRHDHHLVPRAYGGVDGPTATICDTHHSKTHRISECLIYGKPYHQYLRGETNEATRKLLYMAQVIRNAWAAHSKDPNKLAQVVLSLDGDQRRMIDQLRKVYPKTKGRADVIQIALRALYSKHFG